MVRVGDEELEDYIDTSARAWNAPREAVAAHSQPDPKQVRFLAWADGVAAGAAALGDLGDHAYLTGAAVIDAHRGRGLYRALVAARLAHCRARDIPLAVTQAREGTSAPILERLGFETVYRFDMFAG